jgi:aspartyl/asparaginyl beta-hydroxylase (cupin superfamily)
MMQSLECLAMGNEARGGGLPPRFLKYIAQLQSSTERLRMNTYPGLTAQPWYDPEKFPIVRDLERHASEIIAEAQTLDERFFTDETENIERVGRWGVYFFYERGRKNEEHCGLCPATTAVIEAHRTVTTMAGQIYFSCLGPKTHVASHRGPTNMRLRCHLGVEVPAECGLRVGKIEATWTPGRCIVFDECYNHEVWNFSDQRRIVLIVDVWHPDLSDEEVLLLDGLQRYAAGQRKNLTKYWTRMDRERARQAVQ